MLHELTTLPTRLPNGDLYVEYVGWETAADKSRMTARGYRPQPGDVAVTLRHGLTRGNVIHGQFANDHKMQMPGFAKRQTDTEATWNIEAWLHREQNRKLSGTRDRLGRLYAMRDARGTTLNLQVAASGDDGHTLYATATTYPSNATLYAGNFFSASANAWSRFVASLSAVVIDSAVFSLFCSSQSDPFGGAPSLKLRAAATSGATNPTSPADHTSRTRTTAVTLVSSVIVGDWNEIIATGIVQEVVDLSADALLMLLDDNGSSEQVNVYTSYDGNPTFSPKLDIDYTAASPAGNSGNRSILSGGEL